MNCLDIYTGKIDQQQAFYDLYRIVVDIYHDKIDLYLIRILKCNKSMVYNELFFVALRFV